MTDQQQPAKAPLGKGAGVTLAVLVAVLGWFVVPEEGIVLETYPDPVHGVALPTACIGETGPHIRMGQKFTLGECMEMLRARHERLIVAVGRCVRVPVTTHEAVAILSMSDNLGVGAICGSTMVRQINAGAPASTWCEQIPRWHFAGGRDCWVRSSNCSGLVKRRERERAMCLGDITLPDTTPDFTPVTFH